MRPSNYAIITALLIVSACFITASYTFAAMPRAGWTVFMGTYVGTTTACAPNEALAGAAAMEYETMDLVDPADSITINLEAVDLTTGDVKMTDSTVGKATSTGVCFDPINDGVYVNIDGGSAYRNIGNLIYAWDDADAAYLSGHQYRLHVHLLPVSAAVPTQITPLSPGPFTWQTVDPTYSVDTTMLPLLYNATRITATYLLLSSDAGDTSYYDGTNGGEGTYTIRAQGLADGIYHWAVIHAMNGRKVDILDDDDNTRFETFEIPQSHLSMWQTFGIDSTLIPPTHRYATTTENETTVSYTFSADGEDSLSGVASTTMYVMNLASLDTYTYTWHMHGTIDPFTVNRSGTLPRGNTYSYWVEVEDVAGNIQATETYTIVVPPLPGDTTAPTVTIDYATTTEDATFVYYDLSHTVRDTESGMGSTTTYLHNTVTGDQYSRSIVGLSGTTALVELTWPNIQLLRDTIFEYWVTAEDTAGNIAESEHVFISVPPIPPSATLSADSCIIPEGMTSCPATVTWNIDNASDPNLYDSSTDSIISTDATNSTDITFDHGVHVLQARDGNAELYEDILSATCESGTDWIGGVCAPDLIPQ